MIDRIRTGFRTYLHDLRLMTPNARKYLLASFLIGLTMAAFSLLLNLYLKERGFGEAFIGRVLSSGAIGMMVMSIPGAILLSRVRLKPVLLIGSALFGLSCLLTVVASDRMVILAVYFVAGVSISFFRIASAPFFMRNSTERERPYLFFLSFGLTLAAGVIGSLVFGKLVEVFNLQLGLGIVQAHRLALAVGISFSLAALIPFALLETPNHLPREERLEFNFKILAPVKKLIFKLTLPYFLVGAGAGLIIPFLNLFFRDRFGKSPEQIGFYFGLVNLCMLAGVLTGPVLLKKIGMVRTMVFTQLASIPFMLVLAFSYNFPLVLAAFLLRGGLMNLGYPVGTNFAMELVPKSHHGLVNAIMMFAWTSAWMMSTQVGGMIIEKYGYTPTLLVTVVLYVISALLYFFSFRKAERMCDGKVIIQAEYRMAG